MVEVPYVPLSFLQGLYLYSDRCVHRKPLLGILIAMIIIGLWHEISLPFVIWGLLQATGMYVAFLLRDRPSSVFTRNLGRLFVLNYFTLTCVVIDYESLPKALEVYKILFFIN